MNVVNTKFKGLRIIEPVVYEDHRGFFMESFNAQKFKEYGMEFNFVQDNHSMSSSVGVIRGLHYQLSPYAQSKLIRVVSGSIYDVVVDLRKTSASYGEWYGIVLSCYNRRQLLIPKGFAHGFCTLESNTQVIYKTDAFYSPEYDRGILWNDPALGIDWPTDQPILSDKDTKHPVLRDAEINFD